MTKPLRRSVLPVLLFCVFVSAPAFADESYCGSDSGLSQQMAQVEDLAASLGQVREEYLIQLEDGTELVVTDLTEEFPEETGLMDNASSKHRRKGRKKARYTNRGILGPKGKWPVGKGNCTTLAGQASFYGGGEKLKRHTASGKVFSANKLAAAHRTLPLGAKVEITNVKNGRKISSVVINDRGPAIETGRELDVTRAVAQKLGFVGAGHTQVKIRVCR